jgi:ribulose-5-phosphate 4-epimerase/fuculose-1-phosphate aldolase
LNQALNELITIGNYLGSDLYQVQAAGGNVSIKLDADQMLIKASGSRMKELQSQKGWTLLAYSRLPKVFTTIQKEYHRELERESQYADAIGKASLIPDRQPSMEAGFHAVIPDPYVIHVHSIAGIILGLFPESTIQNFLRECFSQAVEVILIPTCLPGFEVTDCIQSLVQTKTESARILLLKNHGVIWCGSQWTILKSLIDRFEAFFQEKWEFLKYPPLHEAGRLGCFQSTPPPAAKFTKTLCWCRWPNHRFDLEPSFPDFIMYFNFWTGEKDLVWDGKSNIQIHSSNLERLKDQEEVLWAHTLICSVADRQGVLQFMPRKMIHLIKNLETERLRFKKIEESK